MCDLCGADASPVDSSRPQYRVFGVRDICPNCLGKIERYHGEVQDALVHLNNEWIKLYITDLKRKEAQPWA